MRLSITTEIYLVGLCLFLHLITPCTFFYDRPTLTRLTKRMSSHISQCPCLLALPSALTLRLPEGHREAGKPGHGSLVESVALTASLLATAAWLRVWPSLPLWPIMAAWLRAWPSLLATAAWLRAWPSLPHCLSAGHGSVALTASLLVESVALTASLATAAWRRAWPSLPLWPIMAALKSSCKVLLGN